MLPEQRVHLPARFSDFLPEYACRFPH